MREGKAAFRLLSAGPASATHALGVPRELEPDVRYAQERVVVAEEAQPAAHHPEPGCLGWASVHPHISGHRAEGTVTAASLEEGV